ncbi:MAG: hypothetical protein OEZ02_09490 [Anaerolineae bacterium]|nr:hypothetical protein [Anaerolineae bacterium]
MSVRKIWLFVWINVLALLMVSCTGGKAIVQALSFLEFNERLAYRWAPIHSQDVDVTGGNGLEGKADYITNVDFDGDWNTLDNWENAPNHALRAYAYYSVVATSTHWFILYAFYHPRDWSDTPIVGGVDEHENDLEGLLAIVKRPPIFSNDGLGELLGIVTVCHNDFYSYTPSGSPLTDGEEDVDGTVNMKAFDGVLHPRTAQTSKSHCLKVPPYVRIEGGDGVIYFPKGYAQVPSGPNDREVGYALVNIFIGEGMWERRGNAETFYGFGVFRGDNGKDNAAHAPWGWDDNDDGSKLTGGELAIDPAKLVQIYFNGLGDFSRVYTYNGYQDIGCDWPEGC